VIERELSHAVALALSSKESEPLLLAKSTFSDLTVDQQSHLAFAGWHSLIKEGNRNRRNKLTVENADLVRFSVPGPDKLQRWHHLKDASLIELRQYRAQHLRRADQHVAKAVNVDRLIAAMEEANVDRVCDLPNWVDVLNGSTSGDV
jgi:hypothetical protein